MNNSFVMQGLQSVNQVIQNGGGSLEITKVEKDYNMKNSIIINGKKFNTSQRAKEIGNQQGMGMPEMKTIYALLPEEFAKRKFGYSQSSASLMEVDGVIFLYTGCTHFNGHINGYTEGVYEVRGKEVKGMTSSEFAEIENVSYR
jgi:hypothetical protein